MERWNKLDIPLSSLREGTVDSYRVDKVKTFLIATCKHVPFDHHESPHLCYKSFPIVFPDMQFIDGLKMIVLHKPFPGKVYGHQSH